MYATNQLILFNFFEQTQLETTHKGGYNRMIYH